MHDVPVLPPPPVSDVVLLDYPVQLGAAQQEHFDGVVRELQLIALSSRETSRHLAGRLLELVSTLTRDHAVGLAEPERQREQALIEGRATVDLHYPVTPDAAAIVQAWARMLRDIDELCRTDDLLVLERPSDIVLMQDWVLGQFLAQLAGQPPTGWTGPLA